MIDQIRKLAVEALKVDFPSAVDGTQFTVGYVRGFIAGRTSVTRRQIAEELSKHHFIHGIGRSNSCHCGAQVGEFAEYRNHEADAVFALFGEVAKDG